MGNTNIFKMTKPYVTFAKYDGLINSIQQMCKRYNKYYDLQLIKDCINEYIDSNIGRTFIDKHKERLARDNFVIHSYMSKVFYTKEYKNLTYKDSI